MRVGLRQITKLYTLLEISFTKKHRHLEVRKSITYISPGYNLETFFSLSYFSKVEVKALLDRVVKSGISQTFGLVCMRIIPSGVNTS